ncbi:MAG: hypothetical protein DGJ47_000298 [Rickettsiaceae bacterium]
MKQVEIISTLHKKSFLLLVLLVILDQLSKQLLISTINSSGQEVEILPFFKLISAWNYGISFGLFSEYQTYSNMAFLIINTSIIFYLFCCYVCTSSKYVIISLAIIIAGAIGNLIDRIFRGAVFDFLYFYYESYSFPAFNIADMCISVGVFMYIYYVIYEDTK